MVDTVENLILYKNFMCEQKVIVGAYYLEITIKTVCIGPMIQWPNLRMAK